MQQNHDVDFTKFQEFFKDPSNPQKQKDMLEEIIAISSHANLESGDAIVDYIMSKLADIQSNGEPKLKPDLFKGASETQILEAYKYLSVLQVFISEVMSASSDSDAHGNLLYTLNTSIIALLGKNFSADNNPTINVDVLRFLLDKVNILANNNLKKFVHMATSHARDDKSTSDVFSIVLNAAKATLFLSNIGEDTKKQLTELINEIELLQKENVSPELTTACINALVEICNFINDPSKKDALIRLHQGFFLQSAKNGEFNALHKEISAVLNGNQSTKDNISCLILTVKSCRIVNNPKLSSDSAYRDAYLKNADGMNEKISEKVKKFISSILQMLNINNLPTFFSTRKIEISKKQQALLKQQKEQEKAVSQTPTKGPSPF